MIFNESSTISEWHHLQLSEPEFLAMIAEEGTVFFELEKNQFTRSVSGANWGKTQVLSEEIDAWLREHCAFQRHEYWGFPRIVYSESAKPKLDGDWETDFTPAGFNQRNWEFRSDLRRIYFRRKEYAMAFKLAFHMVEDGYVG